MLFDLHLIVQNPNLLSLIIELIACSIKIYLLFFLSLKVAQPTKIRKQFFLLLSIIICSAIIDISWLIWLVQKILFSNENYRCLAIFIARCAWAVNYILFLVLGFFVESLCEKNYILKLRQKFFIALGIPWVIYYISIAFIQFNVIANENRFFEHIVNKIGTISIPLFLVIPALYSTIIKLRKNDFPKILKKQVAVLIKYLILPYVITQIMDFFSIFHSKPYIIAGLSNAFLAYAIYFSISKIMKLRFLNFADTIQASEKFTFIDHFKTFLANIGKAKSLNEIDLITQTFFKDSLTINPARVTLHYRQIAFDMPYDNNNQIQHLTFEESAVEKIINNPIKNEKILDLLKKQQILIYDDVEFSNFYQEESVNKEILSFMKEIKADVFLPIYEQNNLIAYLIIGHATRTCNHEFFNNLEHDQMVILGSYLGHIITMLQLSNYRNLLAQNKILTERLYQTHQENNQYRESIQSFFHDNRQRQTGVLFYKNYHFTFGNQAAKELIPVNIHLLDGHPITKALKKLVKQVEEYKTSQSITVNDLKGTNLVLNALPHLEKNNIIITVAHPEISDVLKQQMNQLRNPSEWEYLLYLQTTESGKLINRLIPGSSRPLLNFKIKVLQASLSKNAILLDLPHDDLEQTTEILHHISLRENIHNVTMNSYEKGGAIAIKLFGMNPIFGVFEQALLEQLNNVGTLFIQDIHLLELATQEALAEFLKYGYYTVCKSNKRVFADVRIICSTSQNLQLLVQENKFSKTLFEELRKTTLTMPSLFDLSEEELDELIKEFSQQEVSNANNFQKLLAFTQRDKDQLLKTRSVSLNGFRKKINQILVEKTKKHEIYHSVTFDPASHIADNELAEAARLGKNALRDRKKLILLMEKFDYNQNKVAAFLGVNRSSINRRLKAYKIEIYNDESQAPDDTNQDTINNIKADVKAIETPLDNNNEPEFKN